MDKVKHLLSPLASGTINDTLVSLQNPRPLSRITGECQRDHFIPSRNSSSLVVRWKPLAGRPSLPGTALWTVTPSLSFFSSAHMLSGGFPQNSFLPYRALFPGGLPCKYLPAIEHKSHPELRWGSLRSMIGTLPPPPLFPRCEFEGSHSVIAG